MNEGKFSNSRQARQKENGRYLWLVLLTLVVVGGGLIGLIYGWSALLTAVPCLLGGAALILIPWGVLTLLEKWRNWVEIGD